MSSSISFHSSTYICTSTYGAIIGGHHPDRIGARRETNRKQMQRALGIVQSVLQIQNICLYLLITSLPDNSLRSFLFSFQSANSALQNKEQPLKRTRLAIRRVMSKGGFYPTKKAQVILRLPSKFDLLNNAYNNLISYHYKIISLMSIIIQHNNSNYKI